MSLWGRGEGVRGFGAEELGCMASSSFLQQLTMRESVSFLTSQALLPFPSLQLVYLKLYIQDDEIFVMICQDISAFSMNEEITQVIKIIHDLTN